MTSGEAVPLADLLEGMVDDAVPQLGVSGLEADSRSIKSGDLFVALKGHRVHGLSFLDAAMKAGCRGVVYEPEGVPDDLLDALDPDLIAVPVPRLSDQLGVIAQRFYWQGLSQPRIIAVTGTNGKTSCTHYLAQTLDPKGTAAVIGTLGWGVPPHLEPTRHTTPDPLSLHRMLGSLARSGNEWVALEASSHGLAQSRLTGLHIEGALFTNFTRDHLDYHGSMEAYLESKLALLEIPGLRFVVFHAAQPFAGPILERVMPGVSCLGYCHEDFKGPVAVPLLRYGDARTDGSGLHFKVTFEDAEAWVSVPVFGQFNVENVAGTLAVLLSMGVDLPKAVERVKLICGVAGRMERIVGADRQVVIDFAHTPDALASILKAVRPHVAGTLWLIFGCGGNRDAGKRAEMGAIAAALADRVIITDDNPRDEEGDVIVRDILSGISGQTPTIIRDRRRAIESALSAMQPGDLLILAGKGHETTQEILGVKYPFSDRMVVEEICGSLRGWESGHGVGDSRGEACC